jgi:hypothetical protein
MIRVMGGVVKARLVGMIVRMQAVAVRHMSVMRRLVMVARLVMRSGLMMMLGGLLMVVSGLAVMVSAFVRCRHIHVLREVITLRNRPAIGFYESFSLVWRLYTPEIESIIDNISVTNGGYASSI